MATYLVVTYDITDRKRYVQYNPGSLDISMRTLAKHGGEMVFSGKNPEFIAGDDRKIAVCLKFPTAEAAKAWHDDPEYAPAKAIRMESTTNITAFLMPEYQAPKPKS